MRSAKQAGRIGRRRNPTTHRAAKVPVGGWKPSGARDCFFGPVDGWVRIEEMDRGELTAARKVPGSAIVEEESSLTVVLPGWIARLDDWSDIVLEREGR